MDYQAPYYMSVGGGCPYNCLLINGTDYWSRCALPGSTCDFMPCYCFGSGIEN